MANEDDSRQSVSAMVALRSIAETCVRVLLALAFTVLALQCVAQDSPSTPPSSPPTPPTASQSAVESKVAHQALVLTIPGGSRLALVLTSPVASKTVHRGDTIYAQTIAPVTVDSAVAIPAGSFVQGVVEKLRRDGNRAEIQLQSVSVILPGGYVAQVAGPLQVESDEGTAWRVATKGGVIGTIAAPALGAAGGALIGHSFNSSSGTTLNGLTINPSRLQSTAIGSMAGLGAGAAVGLVLLMRTRQFYVEAGSPMQMTLPQSLTLEQDKIGDMTGPGQSQPLVTPVVRRPVGPVFNPSVPDSSTSHTCHTPDTPGTPPTVIPGTPPIGDSPGTPDIVIPGTPAIPGSPYPCD
jgi:hypothetical protein